MKSLQFLFIVLLLPAVVYTQISSSSIDLIGGVDYTFRTLKYTKGQEPTQSELEYREAEEHAKFNYHFGLNFNQRITKNIWLKAGINYASFGYKGEKIEDLRWPSEHDGSGGWAPDPTLFHESQNYYNHRFIEIPIVGRYEFTGKRLIPFIEIGVSPSFYINTKTTQKTDLGRTSSTEKNDEIKSTLVGAVFSVGVNYGITERISLIVQPVFHRQLSNLEGRLLKEYLFSYRLEVGMRYSL